MTSLDTEILCKNRQNSPKMLENQQIEPKNMKYITCQMGDAFVVGLEGPDDVVALDVNLAHNLFDATARYDIFNGRINFLSSAQFMRFLIRREWLVNGQCLRSAGKAARRVLATQTRREDFMRQLRQHSNNYYDVTSLTHKDNESEN